MNNQETQTSEAARPISEPDNVPEVLQALRTRTIALLDELTNQGLSCGLPEPPAPMPLAHQRLEHDAYRVAVAAEKGACATALINALVGHPLLPPDLVRQTGIPLLIQPPPAEPSPSITAQWVRLADDTTWPLARLTSEAIAEELASLGFEQFVRWIEVETPIRHLPANISLVNLPGFDTFTAPHSDAEPAFEQLTSWGDALQSVLPATDAVIFIIEDAQSVGDASLALIQMLLDMTRKIFFVQLIDVQKQTPEQGLATAQTSEDRLADQFGNLLPDLRVWPISPELLLLAAQDESLRGAELHQAMMAALDSFLFRTTGVSRSEQALLRGEEYYRDGLAVLAARLAGLSKQSAQERATQRDSIQRAIEALGHDWGQRGTKRRQLLDDLGASFRNGRQRFEDALTQIEEAHASKIEELRKIDAAKMLSEEMEGNVARAAFESRQQLEHELRTRVLELLRPFAQEAGAVGTLLSARGNDSPVLPRFASQTREDWSNDQLDLLSGGSDDRTTLTKEAVGLLGAVGLISAGVTPYVMPLITVWSLVQSHRLQERKNVERARRELRARLHLIMSGIRRYYLPDRSLNGGERVGEVDVLIATLRQDAVTMLDAVAESKANDVREEMLALAEADKIGEHRRAQQEARLKQWLKDWYDLGDTLQTLKDTARELEQTQPITTAGQSLLDWRPRPSARPRPSGTARTPAPGRARSSDNADPDGERPERWQKRRPADEIETTPLFRRLVVDANGGTAYRAVADAIRAAAPGETILLRPGTYREALVIEKNVTLEGTGKRDEIIIEAHDQPVVRFRSDSGRLANLTLRQLGGEAFGAVDIERGSPLIEDCTISSQTLDGVAVHGHDANPTIRRNRIHHAQTSGIFVFDHARARIEDNDIFANGTNGISAMTHGTPNATGNRIHDNQHSGVYVFDDGRGVFTRNDIFANTRDGIVFGNDAKVTILENRLHHNTNCGVFAFERGTGAIKGNEIHHNGMNGVAMMSGGDLFIQNNRIHNNQHSAVYSFDRGLGTIQDNDLFENGHNGVAIGGQSDALVRLNRIYRNTHSGVYVFEDGEGGTIEENEIFANERDGVRIQKRHAHLIARNRIHDNGWNGVTTSEGGGSTFLGNSVVGNKLNNWDIADLESAVPESGDRLVITEPRDGQQLIDESGIGRVIDIAGRLDPSAIKPGRVVEVVIHTDIDYPQGEVSPAPDGTWRHEWNHLGGSTHRIFAVLRENDEPLFRSAVVTVDVVRRS